VVNMLKDHEIPKRYEYGSDWMAFVKAAEENIDAYDIFLNGFRKALKEAKNPAEDERFIVLFCQPLADHIDMLDQCLECITRYIQEEVGNRNEAYRLAKSSPLGHVREKLKHVYRDIPGPCRISASKKKAKEMYRNEEMMEYLYKDV
jgi:hypothetical protein